VARFSFLIRMKSETRKLTKKPQHKERKDNNNTILFIHREICVQGVVAFLSGKKNEKVNKLKMKA
jgi:hypothetical protein